MSRRLILRHRGSDCSDGSMRSRLLFDCILHCLFTLFGRGILFIFIVNELRHLSCGLISGVDRIHCLRCLSRRIVLRNN